jgi:hypothetical protein
MEELIKMVTSKVGISESQAKSAIETVVSFLKDKLPGGLGGQVESLLHSKGSGENGVDDIKNSR